MAIRPTEEIKGGGLSQQHWSQDPTPAPHDAPVAPDALTLAFAEAYAELAAAPTDDVFCADLLSFIQSHRCFAHRPEPLDHAGILARFHALPDTELTPFLMTAATPDYVGLDILFDDRVLPDSPRCAAAISVGRSCPTRGGSPGL